MMMANHSLNTGSAPAATSQQECAKNLTRSVQSLLSHWQASAYGDLSACEVFRDPVERSHFRQKIIASVNAAEIRVNILFTDFNQALNLTAEKPSASSVDKLMAELVVAETDLQKFSAERSTPSKAVEKIMAQLHADAEKELGKSESWEIMSAIDDGRLKISFAYEPQSVAAAVLYNEALLSRLQQFKQKVWDEWGPSANPNYHRP